VVYFGQRIFSTTVSSYRPSPSKDGHTYNSDQTANDLRARLQGKKLISAREIAELGIVKSEATLTRWRTLKIGPPCFRLSPGKIIYPVDGLLSWLISCYLKTPSDTKEKADSPSKEPVA